MFDIETCEERKIGLVRFYGQLTESDFDVLDAIGRAARDGPAYDMTGVEHAYLATEFVSKRGKLPQANPNRRRLYVVPQDDLKLLVRLYAAYQKAAGWPAPVVVDTLQAALDQLQVARTDFKPFSFPRSA